MIDLQRLLDTAAENWGTDADSIIGFDRTARTTGARAAVAMALRRNTDYTVAEIADFLRRSQSAVSGLLTTFDFRLEDKLYKRRWLDLCKALALKP